jgi:transcription elongation factor Elf1
MIKIKPNCPLCRHEEFTTSYIVLDKDIHRSTQETRQEVLVCAHCGAVLGLFHPFVLDEIEAINHKLDVIMGNAPDGIPLKPVS